MNALFTRIRWRLVGWNLLVSSLLLVAVGALVYVSLSRSLLDAVDRGLASRADEVGANLHELERDEVELGREGYRGGFFYLVIDPNGRILANPQGVSFTGPPPRLGPDGSPRYETLDLQGEPARVYVRPLRLRRPLPAAIVVGQSIAQEQQALNRLLLVLLAGGGGGIVLALGGAWFLAGRALVPIQQAFTRQQEFVADASHELRTPLTVLRSATDLLNRHRDEPLAANGELFDDVRQEIARLERLAGDLLTLARSDFGEIALAVGEVDLASLTADVVRRMKPLAQERGVKLDHQAPDGALFLEADPDRLQQVLLILLDNALKHTPSGGQITARVRRHGGEAVLEISDTGEGIPPEHLPRVFDRFYRVDRARSRARGGAGLGLAIARSLVEAHGGQLELASAPGAGTTATVRLPLSSRPPSLAGKLGSLVARVASRPARSPL